MVARSSIFLPAFKTLTVIGGAVAAKIDRNDDASIGQIVSAGVNAVFGPYMKNTVFTLVGEASYTISDKPVFEADAVTSNYTVVATDAGKLLKVNSAEAATFTLPADLPEGFGCAVMQLGAGAITFVAGSGATMVNVNDATASVGQYALVGINVYDNPSGFSAAWVLSGDVA